MKLYFASPVHLAAGAGKPGGSNGAKSNGAADVMDARSRSVFVEKAGIQLPGDQFCPTILIGLPWLMKA
jgi:hypothetical protein